jgi:hypothetical protein
MIQEKRVACDENGIKLIEIPYWWDFTKDSLVATIHMHRPDLIKTPGHGKVISAIPPVKLIQSLSKNIY